MRKSYLGRLSNVDAFLCILSKFNWFDKFQNGRGAKTEQIDDRTFALSSKDLEVDELLDLTQKIQNSTKVTIANIKLVVTINKDWNRKIGFK